MENSLELKKTRFKEETHRITDDSFRRFILGCIEDFNTYFWTAPASGSGMYHTDDEHYEGGLVLHTRRVIQICVDLSKLNNLLPLETDILICAAILHDSLSKGIKDTDRHSTDPFHPIYVPFEFSYVKYGAKFIEERFYDEIMLCVVSHSGRYSVTKALNVDKKLPRLLQTADFLASRKHIKINLKD